MNNKWAGQSTQSAKPAAKMTDSREDEIVERRKMARAKLEQEEESYARNELDKAKALGERAERSLSKGKRVASAEKTKQSYVSVG